MTLGKVLVVLIVTLSGIAVGGALSLVVLHIHDILKGPERVIAVAFASARLGFGVMVGLVAQALTRVGTVDTHDWRVWAYVVASGFTGGGYLALAINEFVHWLRRRKT